MEETSGGALHSSTFCCCVREIMPFHKLFLVFFSSRISAEERRSSYEDDFDASGRESFDAARSASSAICRGRDCVLRGCSGWSKELQVILRPETVSTKLLPIMKFPLLLMLVALRSARERFALPSSALGCALQLCKWTPTSQQTPHRGN